ncbi:MAG: DUF6064 family protein [Bacteroidales bacterium]
MPFSTEQFFSVFEQYNHAIFPGQMIILLFGLLSIVLIHTQRSSKDKLIGLILGLLWLWVGVVYHLGFFARINPVARVFGFVFILQGLLIVYTAIQNRLRFTFKNQANEYVGYFFILFGLIIYPLIGFFIHYEPSGIISLGLPCPTTIFTFGLFIMARNHFPKYLLIIPSLWAVAGISAAVNFGVKQDFMLILSAVVAIVFILTKKKRAVNQEISR